MKKNAAKHKPITADHFSRPRPQLPIRNVVPPPERVRLRGAAAASVAGLWFVQWAEEAARCAGDWRGQEGEGGQGEESCREQVQVFAQGELNFVCPYLIKCFISYKVETCF